MNDAVVIALALPVTGAVAAVVNGWLQYQLKKRAQVHELAATDANVIDQMRATIKDMQRDINGLQGELTGIHSALRKSDERGDAFKQLAEQRLEEFNGFKPRIVQLEAALQKAGMFVPPDVHTDAAEPPSKPPGAESDTVAVKIVGELLDKGKPK